MLIHKDLGKQLKCKDLFQGCKDSTIKYLPPQIQTVLRRNNFEMTIMIGEI